MPRSSNKEPGSKPSSDVGWNFATPTGKKGELMCNFCNRKITGGITRLKQHLAHMSGQVESCKQVPQDVRTDMYKLLKDFEEAKNQKKKREKELEDEIMRMNEMEDVDEDEAFEQARHESIRQYQKDHYRRSRGATYDAGGSSRQDQSTRLGRSFSVHEGGAGGSRFPPGSTPASRLATREVEIEKNKVQSKQAKVNSKWFKNQKEKLAKVFGNFVIHNRLPFSIADSPWTRPLLRTAAEVGPNIPPPTPYEIAEVFLPNEYKLMKEYIASFESIWNTRGVTIMCDGWSGTTRMSIINFLIYSNRGTIFHKSVDASLVPSKNADYYFGLMKSVVQEIGHEKVVQIVTDNEAAMKAGGKKLMDEFPHIYWTACAAHCIDLILEDIGKRKKIKEVVDQAKIITQFIYNHNWVCNYMKKFTEGRDILRPGITRFATNFIAIESIVRQRIGLRNMFESEGWLTSKYGKATSGPAFEVKQIILCLSSEGRKFWQKANEVLKIQKPLLKVLKLVDGDEKPTMGFIYEAIERAKLAIKENCRSYANYWRIIDERWNFQLHHDLHAAGYFLNPQFQYGKHDIGKEREVMAGLKKVIQKLELDLDNQVKALNQVFIFQDKMESFGTALAQRAIKFTDPAEWWIQYGESAPELQAIAVKVLSQTTSASNCERNWSTFSLIHTKTRNRLRYQKLQSLVFVHYNMRLKIRNATRKSREELDKSYNPINLDYIFEEDDPLSPWLEEREQPLLDGQNNTWLDDDEDNTCQGQASQSRSRGIEISAARSHGGISSPGGSGDDSGDNDIDDDTSHSSDGNNNSGPPNASGETYVPSTYPYDRDVYFIQGDVDNSSYDPSPPPMDQTYYLSHGDFYPSVGESYGDSSDSTANYGYGYDVGSSESSYYNPYSSMGADHYPSSSSQSFAQPQHLNAHEDDTNHSNFMDSLFAPPAAYMYPSQEDDSAPVFIPHRHSFWH